MKRTAFLLGALLVACAPEAGTPPRTAPRERTTDVVVAPGPAAPADRTRPWGAPVPGAADERQVMAVLAAVGGAAGDAPSRVESVLMVGPALWAMLLQSDPAVKRLGTPSQARVASGGGVQMLDMRAFVNAGQVGALLGARAFQRVLLLFSGGRARPAAERERRIFYALIPFEIAGKPLTVVERDDDRLVAVLKDGRLVWIDLLSGYGIR